MADNENEEFEFRLRAEQEAMHTPLKARGHGPLAPQPATWNDFNPIEAAGEGAAQLTSGIGAAALGGLGYGITAAGKAIGATDAEPKEVMGRIAGALTYQPTTKSSQLVERVARTAFAPAVRKVAEVGDNAATAVGKISPTAETFMREAPAAFQAAGSIMPLAALGQPAMATGRSMIGNMAAARRAAVELKTATPEDILTRMAAKSQQNMGAADAAPSLTNASPELRQAITQNARKTGGAINPEVLTRHIEADTLPVPVRLTEGQATQDPMVISREMNTRGSNGVMVDHLNEQNKQLARNVQAIRDQAGPDVFSTSPVEHGDTLIAAYRAKNEAAQAQVSAHYKALKDASAGGQFPVDAQALLGNAIAKLHQDLLFDHAPKSIMTTLGRLADQQSMTFENFESLRTNLARIQRSLTADGNEKAAAGVIRDEMEKLPLSPWAQSLKPLADQARAAARTQFQALDADPAYKAAVNETVSPDRFVNRFVINGARDDVALMRENLAHDDRATQTMSVAALDHLRDAARLNPHYEGNFAAASFNKGLQSLSPKISSLVSPQVAEQLEKLGNVARYTTAQPRGSLVNNSNSHVAAAADYGAKIAEHTVNSAAGGLPVGTAGRKVIEALTRNRTARQAIAPGAGLNRLQIRPRP